MTTTKSHTNFSLTLHGVSVELATQLSSYLEESKENEMIEPELGKWYKHLFSPAYANVVRINVATVKMHFDNGFETLVLKHEFNQQFTITPKSEKMNSKEK